MTEILIIRCDGCGEAIPDEGVCYRTSRTTYGESASREIYHACSAACDRRVLGLLLREAGTRETDNSARPADGAPAAGAAQDAGTLEAADGATAPSDEDLLPADHRLARTLFSMCAYGKDVSLPRIPRISQIPDWALPEGTRGVRGWVVEETAREDAPARQTAILALDPGGVLGKATHDRGEYSFAVRGRATMLETTGAGETIRIALLERAPIKIPSGQAHRILAESGGALVVSWWEDPPDAEEGVEPNAADTTAPADEKLGRGAADGATSQTDEDTPLRAECARLLRETERLQNLLNAAHLRLAELSESDAAWEIGRGTPPAEEHPPAPGDVSARSETAAAMHRWIVEQFGGKAGTVSVWWPEVARIQEIAADYDKALAAAVEPKTAGGDDPPLAEIRHKIRASFAYGKTDASLPRISRIPEWTLPEGTRGVRGWVVAEKAAREGDPPRETAILAIEPGGMLGEATHGQDEFSLAVRGHATWCSSTMLEATGAGETTRIALLEQPPIKIPSGQAHRILAGSDGALVVSWWGDPPGAEEGVEPNAADTTPPVNEDTSIGDSATAPADEDTSIGDSATAPADEDTSIGDSATKKSSPAPANLTSYGRPILTAPELFAALFPMHSERVRRWGRE